MNGMEALFPTYRVPALPKIMTPIFKVFWIANTLQLGAHARTLHHATRHLPPPPPAPPAPYILSFSRGVRDSAATNLAGMMLHTAHC